MITDPRKGEITYSAPNETPEQIVRRIYKDSYNIDIGKDFLFSTSGNVARCFNRDGERLRDADGNELPPISMVPNTDRYSYIHPN